MGRARVEALEDAARLAVASGDEVSALDACYRVVEAAIFSGYPERALAPFERCLAYVDRCPRVGPTFEVLWAYKWVATYAPQSHAIPRWQIEEMLDDMERRYSAVGYGSRGVLYARCVAAAEMGDGREARAYWQDWLNAPHDVMESCEACELDEQVSLLVRFGRHVDAEAVRLAGPMLDGELSCAEVPQRTYAHVLGPLARLGRVDEAERYHDVGYPAVAGNPTYLAEVGEHMAFLGAAGKPDRAAELYERHLPWALEAAGTSRAFYFYIGAIQAMGAQRRLVEPASALAEAFDARNGNAYFSDRLAAAIS
jgi:hypothetical protein